jgi:hypothetical protein
LSLVCRRAKTRYGQAEVEISAEGASRRNRGVLARKHGAEVEDDAIVLDAGDDRRIQRTQVGLDPVGADRPAGLQLDEPRRQLGARRAAAADGRHAVDHASRPAVARERRGDGIGAAADLSGAIASMRWTGTPSRRARSRAPPAWLPARRRSACRRGRRASADDAG